MTPHTFPELHGACALLVPLHPAHEDGLWDAAQDSRIWTYMPQQLNSPHALHQWLLDALAARDRGQEMPFAVVDTLHNRIVGSTRLADISFPNRGVEIGWTWLDPSVWRTPINTECKYLLLKHCFETLDMIRVCLKTDSRNVRSQHAIERLGARREGILRSHRILPDGYARDSVYYSILASEWPDVRQTLEHSLVAFPRAAAEHIP